jgi:hypothetical protein
MAAEALVPLNTNLVHSMVNANMDRSSLKAQPPSFSSQVNSLRKFQNSNDPSKPMQTLLQKASSPRGESSSAAGGRRTSFKPPSQVMALTLNNGRIGESRSAPPPSTSKPEKQKKNVWSEGDLGPSHRPQKPALPAVWSHKRTHGRLP